MHHYQPLDYILIKMLSSFRITPSNIALPLVQSHRFYGAPADRMVKIIRTRVAQKQLYGGVIRNGSPVNADENVNKPLNPKSLSVASNSTIDGINSSTSSRASEFHWLVKQGKSAKTAIKIHLSLHSDDTNSSQNNAEHTSANIAKRTDTDASLPPTTLNARNAISSAKKILKSFVISAPTTKSAAPQEIPFDMDDLNAMIKYPLITAKCSLSQTVALTDRSMKLPSISKVLSATMPEGARIALKKWKSAKIAELGADGFKNYERETFNLGKEFHSAIEQFLIDGETPDADASVNQLWQSVSPSLHELQPKSVLVEQPILHADLKYKGIIDNVSLVR